MCMLIQHSPKSHLTRDMLSNFLDCNPDGFGFMYGDGRKLHVIKLPTPDRKEVFHLYDTYIKGRAAVLHFRMRTHGDINDQNTHPYRVTDDVWMAHNGVLRTGNDANPAMSDTWHLIEGWIRPLLVESPGLLYTRQFQEMLGAFIGSSNKLAFADRKGRIVVINSTAGIVHANTWFSNSYAWDPGRFGVKGYSRRVYKPTFISQAYTPAATTTAAAPAGLSKNQQKKLVKKANRDAIKRANAAGERVIARGSPSQMIAKAAAEVSRGTLDAAYLRKGYRERVAAAIVATRAPGPSGPPVDLQDSRHATTSLREELAKLSTRGF